MNELISNYKDYLTLEIENCYKQERVLLEEDRKDEANMFKIKRNIYGIFDTVLTVSKKQSKMEDKSEVVEQFLEKATAIPAQWEKSYQKAKEHNDVEKILVEEIKLKVVEESLQKFKDLMVLYI